MVAGNSAPGATSQPEWLLRVKTHGMSKWKLAEVKIALLIVLGFSLLKFFTVAEGHFLARQANKINISA